jgi:hypothetical protein
MTIDAAPKGRSARPLGDSVHGDRHVVHARRRLERTVIQAERREDPPPLLADLDCAVRGSDPFLRVCLGSSVISESTPSREHRATDQGPCGQDLRPGGATVRRNPSALCVTPYARRHPSPATRVRLRVFGQPGYIAAAARQNEHSAARRQPRARTRWSVGRLPHMPMSGCSELGNKESATRQLTVRTNPTRDDANIHE